MLLYLTTVLFYRNQDLNLKNISNQLKNKTVIITGASRGIGFETATRLASDGHHVIAIARSKDKLELLKSHNPDQITIYSFDLNNESEFSQLVSSIKKLITKVDILINNAGALINKPFENLTDEDWQQMIDVNLFSGVRLIRELLPVMHSGSHIVNISSMGGFQGSQKFPGLSAYSVAKGALVILTESLAKELNDRGIHINCLCLGAVQTEMLGQAFPGFKAPVTAAEMAAFITDFAVKHGHFFNGKILPVAMNDPE